MGLPVTSKVSRSSIRKTVKWVKEILTWPAFYSVPRARRPIVQVRTAGQDHSDDREQAADWEGALPTRASCPHMISWCCDLRVFRYRGLAQSPDGFRAPLSEPKRSAFCQSSGEFQGRAELSGPLKTLQPAVSEMTTISRNKVGRQSLGIVFSVFIDLLPMSATTTMAALAATVTAPTTATAANESPSAALEPALPVKAADRVM